MFKRWYHSNEKETMILTAWQSMKLSKKMEQDPGLSEVSNLGSFVANMMPQQKQLFTQYHTDKFLCDRLCTAVEISSIQNTLCDKLPQTSHQAVKKGTAGTQVRRWRVPGNSGKKEASKKRTATVKDQDHADLTKVLNPDWMRGAKSCFVCGKYHRETT